jgi:hypothetical protein
VTRPTGGAIEMGLVAVVGGMFATAFAGGDAGLEATAGLVGVAVVGTMIALVERRWTGVYIASAAGVGLVATAAATDADGYAADGWIGWVAVAAGLTMVWLVHRTQLAAHAAASVGVLTATAFVAGRGVTVEDAVAGGMCAVALLTGLALTFQRRTPLDSAAITAGAVMVFAGGLAELAAELVDLVAQAGGVLERSSADASCISSSRVWMRRASSLRERLELALHLVALALTATVLARDRRRAVGAQHRQDVGDRLADGLRVDAVLGVVRDLQPRRRWVSPMARCIESVTCRRT